MTTWEEFSAAEPALAAAVRARFDAARHHILATVRRDGSPRVSGTATEVTDAAELGAFVDAEDPPEPSHLFRLSVDEVVRTSLRDDQKALVIETWRPGAPVKRVDRV